MIPTNHHSGRYQQRKDRELHHTQLQIEQIDEKNEFGSISSRNEGNIINCHIDNINLKIATNYGNGITRYNYGGKL